MSLHDDQNLEMVGGDPSRVDKANQSFYNRFPFPPPPAKFEFVEDERLESRLLAQSLGDWNDRLIPEKPRIWVPGCGRYQALALALQFPTAEVLATDVADESLAECRKTAGQLDLLGRVEILEESILRASYEKEFDYIYCVGVLHHLADPQAGLAVLARALKRSGVLEIMMYNRFHRVVTSAYQKAIRLLCPNDSGGDELITVGREILEEYPLETQLGQFVKTADSESLFADTFLQPVEYSYTVASLAQLAEGCELEMLHPRVTQWDKTWSTTRWNALFKSRELAERYLALDDLDRWQVTNLLLREASPMVWFYLQRKDSARPRKSEKQLCSELLDLKLAANKTRQGCYLRNSDGGYERSENWVDYPPPPEDESIRRIVAHSDGKTTLGDLFVQQGLATDFKTVNDVRRKLTVSAFPFVSTVPEVAESPDLEWKEQQRARLRARIRRGGRRR